MPDSEKIRVLLVDDHAVVRMGLKTFFDLQDDITKGACVTHGGEIVNERAKQMVATA